MNAPAHDSATRPSLAPLAWGMFAILALTLAMMRVPAMPGLKPEIAYQSLLYESLRLGHQWGIDLVTTDGPLAALQAPAYSGGSLWMAMLWQIGGGFLFAVLFVSAACRLPTPARWWALGLIFILLAQASALAPGLALLLLGWALLTNRSTLLWNGLLAAAMGWLGLESVGHLMIGGAAILLGLALGRQSLLQRVFATVAFAASFGLGWLVLGQSWGGLADWLVQALSVVWHTSALLRPADTAYLNPWAAAAALAFLLRGACRFRASRERGALVAPALFLVLAAALAWKAIALQPFGNPGLFFALIAAASFLLIPGRVFSWANVGLVLVALAGLIRWQPALVTDSIGALNRQFVTNVQVLGALPTLRGTLTEQVKQVRAAHLLPHVDAVVGTAEVAVSGDSPDLAFLGGMKPGIRPAPLGHLLRSAAIADLDAQAWTKASPEFVLQRFTPLNDLAPPLNDAEAQLELYRNYQFSLEENDALLWKKTPGASVTAPRVLVQQGALPFGEALPLPPAAPEVSYWLELDVEPNLLGRLWSCLDETADPALLVRDAAGHELHYALLAAVASRGFLVDPFIRGNVDLLALQTGAALPRTKEITVFTPSSAGWLWPKACNYRLYAMSGLKPGGTAPTSAPVLARFQLLNRLPDATWGDFALNLLPGDLGSPILFAHPDSALELAVTAGDHRLRADFALLGAAAEGKNRTDGVDFSAEFIGSDGSHQVIFHRYLDPLYVPADRGLQQAEVILPGRPGRLILRTYNPPERGIAWDWSYWGRIVID